MSAVDEMNVLSISGGKDSTALGLLALERETENMLWVFCDTGNEHALTIEYVDYLHRYVHPVRTIKADFADRMAGKRAFIAANWKPALMRGRPGEWIYTGKEADAIISCRPAFEPENRFKLHKVRDWKWAPEVLPMSETEADDKVARAIAILEPTGNPFLDLCLWKGRMPSTKARFCSEELKKNPIVNQVQLPYLVDGIDVMSWQGVRADESENRRHLPVRDLVQTHASGAELWNFRPILEWTVDQVFAQHDRHGVAPNPLYKLGMGRVGCMPCIHARKDELLEISKRFPAEIDRIAEWEVLASIASKRGATSFFPTQDEHGENVYQVVEWSKTARGGKQFDYLRAHGEVAVCSSIYGLCE